MSAKGGNLFQLLKALPNQGIGTKVMPTKFGSSPTLSNSYYEVTKVNLKEEGSHGRAWGVQVMKGHTMLDGKPVEIRGGLKFKWKTYDA